MYLLRNVPWYATGRNTGIPQGDLPDPGQKGGNSRPFALVWLGVTQGDVVSHCGIYQGPNLDVVIICVSCDV